MYELQKKKKSLALKIAVFVLCLSISAELLRYIFRQPSLQESMVRSANDINKNCPIVIDSNTTLANAMAMAGNQFVFNYTLVHVGKTMFDTTVFKEGMQTQIINAVKTNPSLKPMRDEGIIFNARYSDSSSNYLCTVVVGPWNYK